VRQEEGMFVTLCTITHPHLPPLGGATYLTPPSSHYHGVTVGVFRVLFPLLYTILSSLLLYS
jgi:hypothetical protein